MLSITGACRRIGAQTLFRDLDLAVDSGDCVAVEIGDQAVFFDSTLAEHLELRAATHDVEVDVVDVLDDAGIGDLADRYPHTLSTGQRQRFSLAAVFMLPAELLVLDEPERGLDVDGQEWVAQRISAATADGRAVVVATHSPLVVERCADLVVEMGR